VTARLILLAAALSLAGCFGGSDGRKAERTVATTATGSALPVSAPTSQGTCPLTLPNGQTMPGGREAGMNHGNGKLWTALWPHNVVIATPDYIGRDGSVDMKWPWWWSRTKGKLTITGRRLDGDARPLSAYLPEGYDEGFMPSGLSFPTEGCWEVTGTVGEARLTFVTLVLKASRYWPLKEDGA
jgi:hypothetical protein